MLPFTRSHRPRDICQHRTNSLGAQTAANNPRRHGRVKPQFISDHSNASCPAISRCSAFEAHPRDPGPIALARTIAGTARPTTTVLPACRQSAYGNRPDVGAQFLLTDQLVLRHPAARLGVRSAVRTTHDQEPGELRHATAAAGEDWRPLSDGCDDYALCRHVPGSDKIGSGKRGLWRRMAVPSPASQSLAAAAMSLRLIMPQDAERAASADFLEIEGLEKIYGARDSGVTALKNVTLSIGATEFVSLLGPSGCGKSTLLRCISGLERATAGRIAINGAAVNGPPEDMGMVFQRDVLLDWLTVERNILLPCKVKGLPLQDWAPKARALLDLIGLRGFETRYPWELSGGMRQRVAICRALLLNPPLLLMDEPFGALDAMTRDELNVELQRIWMADAKTVVFVTHSISEAVFLSDRVIVMSRSPGRVVDTVPIDLPRPRPLAIRETEKFGQYVARIRQVFESLGMLRGNHARE